MSKRTQSPSIGQRVAALIRYWLDVPSREEVRPWREDQMHTHRMWALLALERIAQRAGAHYWGPERKDLDDALAEFGQMEPPR